MQSASEDNKVLFTLCQDLLQYIKETDMKSRIIHVGIKACTCMESC